MSDFGLTLEQRAEKSGLFESAPGKYESDDFTDISLYAIKVLRRVRRLSA
jgi:hypothetical protein